MAGENKKREGTCLAPGNSSSRHCNITVPTSYTYGNSGAGILRTDYFGSVSASLSKEFRVTETSRLQFRAEAFNLPNSAYFGGPSTSIDTSTVGRITSTSNSPRQVQVALKYNF